MLMLLAAAATSACHSVHAAVERRERESESKCKSMKEEEEEADTSCNFDLCSFHKKMLYIYFILVTLIAGRREREGKFISPGTRRRARRW